MTSKSFVRFFAKTALSTALVVFPVVGVFATARGATVTSATPARSITPAFTAVASTHTAVSSAAAFPAVAPASSSAAVESISASAPRCAPTLRRIKTRELSAETIQISATIVREHYKDPIGTEIAFDSGNRRFVGRIERHYHEFDSEGRPWGFHKGCSLFEVMPCK